MGGRRQEGGGHRRLLRYVDGARLLPCDQDAVDVFQLAFAVGVRPSLGDGHHALPAAVGLQPAPAARGEGADPAALSHQRDGRAARLDEQSQLGAVAFQPLRRVLYPARALRLGGSARPLLQAEAGEARGHGRRRRGLDGSVLGRRRLCRAPVGAFVADEPAPLLQLRVIRRARGRRAVRALLRGARRVHHWRRRSLHPNLAGGGGRSGHD
mmetsp:Transcript_63946/g.113355  ORF Transcript_63946/g.113355 Transcript_63946/m.113355 type:complete len:211 (+) Transcript_63946:110-742(+)